MPTRHPPVEGSWSAGSSPAARRLAVPLREFLDTLGTSSFTSPRTGQPYREMIDVPSFIETIAES